MKLYGYTAVVALFALTLSACGPAEFGGIASKTSSDSTSESSATDETGGAVAQISVDDFLGLLPQEAAVVAKENRCYISHGGGHGIDVCLAGDKTAISQLWPIEIRGDQLCVPLDTLKNQAALFTGGTIGECGGKADEVENEIEDVPAAPAA